MFKRSAIGALWFVSMWFASDVIGYFAGTPRLIGPLVGLVSAAFFAIDPFGVVYGRRLSRPTLHRAVARVELPVRG